MTSVKIQLVDHTTSTLLMPFMMQYVFLSRNMA